MGSEKHNPTKSKKAGTVTPFRISVHMWWWSNPRDDLSWYLSWFGYRWFWVYLLRIWWYELFRVVWMTYGNPLTDMGLFSSSNNPHPWIWETSKHFKDNSEGLYIITIVRRIYTILRVNLRQILGIFGHFDVNINTNQPSFNLTMGKKNWKIDHLTN